MAFVSRLRLAALLFAAGSSGFAGGSVRAMDAGDRAINAFSERPIIGRPAYRHPGGREERAARRATVTVQRSWSPGFRDPLWRDSGRRNAGSLGGTYVGLNVWRDSGNGVFVSGGAQYGGTGYDKEWYGWSPLVRPRIIHVTPATHSCSMEAGVCVVRGQ